MNTAERKYEVARRNASMRAKIALERAKSGVGVGGENVGLEA